MCMALYVNVCAHVCVRVAYVSIIVVCMCVCVCACMSVEVFIRVCTLFSLKCVQMSRLCRRMRKCMNMTLYIVCAYIILELYYYTVLTIEARQSI